MLQRRRYCTPISTKRVNLLPSRFLRRLMMFPSFGQHGRELITIMIMQYGRTGLIDIALRTFRGMKDGNHKPTESTYKFLIICLCGKKGRNIDVAIKLFHEMIEMGCRPDEELAEAYLGCLCEVGKLGDARGYIESLQKI